MNIRLPLATCLAMAFAAPLQAQSSAAGTPAVELPAMQPGRIRGVAFDSLLMQPVARATVMLMDGTQTITTDDKGRFEFTDIAPGQHFIAFSTPALDSLGLGTLGTAVLLPPGAIISVKIGTPSFHTLWTYRCASAPVLGSDSSIVWGTIRDAATNAELPKASAEFSWYDLDRGRATGLLLSQVRKEAPTDDQGHYFACGLPTDVAIASIAVGNAAASGAVQYAIGSQRLRRMDFLVSTDMVIPDSVHYLTEADSLAAERPRGHAIIRGTVLDDRKRPVHDATIDIASADTSVRTNEAGEFVMAGLPSGTHAMQVRRVGYAPNERLIDLRPEQTTQLQIEMSQVNTLATVNVRAGSGKGSDRLDYESRKKMGRGHFIETKELANRPDVGSALSRVPGVFVKYSGFGFDVQMRGGFTMWCKPAVFLDGLPSDLDVVNMRMPEDFRAIEVYPRGGVAPLEYSTLNGCGAILFWSRNSRW
jgi:hypothetical protein